MSMPSAHPAYPMPGQELDGKYVIERMLGEGGMGAVALAMHKLRKARVALKFMNPMYMSVPGAVDRFHNEGVAASQIASDHCVQIFDVGSLPSGAPYLVMEYLEGKDLSDLLARDGRPGLPVERAVHFVLQILRGLQAAHAKGIVHRDMKPSNCFVITKDGEDDFVKLLDFGISKVRLPGEQALTQTNSALGTPLYMSPEQAKSPKDVDARTDIYSVGVILYELLSGRTPFFSESGEFTEILFKLFTSEPPHIKTARPDLPDALAAVVHKALARDVNHRFPDVIAFGEALGPFASPRSATILQKLRGAAPMSQLAGSQPPKVSLRPPAESAFPTGPNPGAVSSAEVFAATMGAAPSELMIPRPAAVPGVRTDLGASRDATAGGLTPPRKTAPALVVAAIAVPALLLGLGVTAFTLRGKGPTAASASASATAEPPPAPPSSVIVAPVVPSSVVPVTTVAPVPDKPDASVAPPSSSPAPRPPSPPQKKPPSPCSPLNPCLQSGH